MNLNFLQKVLLENFKFALGSSHDKFVRVDLPFSYPLQQVLVELTSEYEDLKVGVLTPFRKINFDEKILNLEERPSVLTKLRNSRRESNSPVLILGPAIGPEESGLRDVAQVISEYEVLRAWQSNFDSIMKKHPNSHDLQVRMKIGTWFFDKLKNGDFSAPLIADLLENLLDTSFSLVDIQQAIFRANLVPDDELVSNSAISSRMEKNLDIIQKAESAESPVFLQKLKKSRKKEVVAFCKWIESRDPADLSKSNLPDLLKALENLDPGVETDDPSEPPRSITNYLFSELLNPLNADKLDLKRTIFGKMKNEIESSTDDFFLYGEIDETINHDDIIYKFRVHFRDSRHIFDWLNDLEKVKSDQSFTDTEKISAFLYGTENTSERKLKGVSTDAIRKFGESLGLEKEVNDYLLIRREVLKSIRLFSASEGEILQVLILSDKFSNLINSYLDSWLILLKAGISKMDEGQNSYFQFLDSIWIQQEGTGDLELEENFQPDTKFQKVVLAGWHPWRLRPIFQLAQEVRGREFEYEAISGAFWALSRAVPLYRVWASTADKDNLQFKTLVAGECEFGIVDTQAIQPLSETPTSIIRSLTAFKEVHPWNLSGTTLAVVNPPEGGAVRRLSQKGIFGDEDLSLVRVIRTKNLAGQDADDNYDSLIGFHDVESPLDYLAKDGQNEVTILFLPAMTASINSIQLGAHGKIELSLNPTALNLDGHQIFEPQITVSPEESNDYVNLLYRASGQAKTHIANYPLVLPESHKRLIEKAVSNSEWTIVAIPGAVGAPEIFMDGDKEKKAFIVAQFDDQQYRCFTYSRSLLPLVWKIRDYINAELPIANTPEKQKVIVESIIRIASLQHTKMFELSNNRFGVTEILGVLCSRAFVESELREGSLILEVSLDDTDWTSSWLDSKDQRADLLIVDISRDLDDPIPVKLFVVEAKARTDAFGSPELDVDPFDSASEQVHVTIDRIRRLMMGNVESVSQSIRLRAFTEQIAAVAASEYLRSTNQKDFDKYFKNISRFISEPESALENIKGLVVAVFLKGLEEAQVKTIQDTTLISCSSKSLEQIFLNQPISRTILKNESPNNQSEKSEENNKTSPVDLMKSVDNENTMVETSYNENLKDISADQTVISASPHKTPHENKTRAAILDSQERESLISELLMNLKLKTTEIDNSESTTLTQGPTYNAFSVPFVPGASIATLQRVSKDIARDLGVPSIDIKNDVLPRRVLVLVPRKDRQFPSQPTDLPEIDKDSYLPIYVGQELDGTDHISSIQSWPHALIAGTTGSGKTSFLRGVISQVAGDTRFPSHLIVVDGKGESDYRGLAKDQNYHPNWVGPQLSIDTTIEILEWLVELEIPRRRKILNELADARNGRVDAKDEYLRLVHEGLLCDFSPIVLVIDEFAELMLRGGKSMNSFADHVSSVSQTGRSTLVHMLLATQRPDRKILPGRIHANLDTKIALRVPTPADSMTVLGHGGAEKLLGRGDMLFSWKGTGDKRIQGYFYP